MKNYMMLILFTLGLVNNSYAQKTQNSTVSSAVIYDDSKKVVEKLYDDGGKMIDKLASKADTLLKKVSPAINSKATALWNIIVKQETVRSWVILFLWIKAIVLLFIAIKLSKQAPKDAEGDLKFSFKGCTAIVSWAAAICLFGYTTYNTIDMFTGFINPEAGAIKTMYQMIIEYKDVTAVKTQ